MSLLEEIDSNPASGTSKVPHAVPVHTLKPKPLTPLPISLQREVYYCDILFSIYFCTKIFLFIV
jgi:hypothetical protein